MSWGGEVGERTPSVSEMGVPPLSAAPGSYLVMSSSCDRTPNPAWSPWAYTQHRHLCSPIAVRNRLDIRQQLRLHIHPNPLLELVHRERRHRHREPCVRHPGQRLHLQLDHLRQLRVVHARGTGGGGSAVAHHLGHHGCRQHRRLRTPVRLPHRRCLQLHLPRQPGQHRGGEERQRLAERDAGQPGAGPSQRSRAPT